MGTKIDENVKKTKSLPEKIGKKEPSPFSENGKKEPTPFSENGKKEPSPFSENGKKEPSPFFVFRFFEGGGVKKQNTRAILIVRVFLLFT
ncbi:MAG: hypothetical protein IJM66_08520 [Muribaculaceae bacterium]|nr:hypothetical protein [Muribaculaceae bacterium]